MNQTDEEQVEELKKWWSENGRAIILGVILGGGAIFGWRFWEAQQLQNAETASNTYQTIYSEFLEGDKDAVHKGELSLRTDFASTPYAALAALLKAKMAIDAEDLDTAAEALDWAMENSPEEDIRHIATLRLARVFNEQNNGDEAIALLNKSFPEAYTALAEELRGDILAGQGQAAQARDAYTRALGASQAGGNTALLQMKIDDLAGDTQS